MDTPFGNSLYQAITSPYKDLRNILHQMSTPSVKSFMIVMNLYKCFLELVNSLYSRSFGLTIYLRIFPLANVEQGFLLTSHILTHLNELGH